MFVHPPPSPSPPSRHSRNGMIKLAKETACVVHLLGAREETEHLLLSLLGAEAERGHRGLNE